METKYNERHAREILEPCNLLGKYLLIDDRGVWPAIEHDKDSPLLREYEVLRWRPTSELQGSPDAPEASEAPMLPMPFTARELAAFMLAGTGAMVADFYGDWSAGPYKESLSQIDPYSNARKAVTEAYAAYRLALGEVGDGDTELQNRANAARVTEAAKK